jgi:hypothetical protein
MPRHVSFPVSLWETSQIKEWPIILMHIGSELFSQGAECTGLVSACAGHRAAVLAHSPA